MNKDEVFCKMRYFASNFTSKVEKHGLLWENSYSRFSVEFCEYKDNLF